MTVEREPAAIRVYRLCERQWRSWCFACNMWCIYTTWTQAFIEGDYHARYVCTMRARHG